jgi:hypothetical protein
VVKVLLGQTTGSSPWRWRIGLLYYHKLVRLSPPSCCCYSYIHFPPSIPHTFRATMTNAHERVTLPPISSFDISPSSKHHSPFQAGPSRRSSHLRGSSSWDGSSGGSNHPHEFDDISYRCATFTFTLWCSMLLTSRLPHAAHLLALARVDMILSTALIMTAVLPPGKHRTITLHIQSQLSLLLHTSQSPQVCGPAAVVVLLIEGVSSCRKYPGIGSLLARAHPHENPRLILKPLSPPL